MPRPRHFACISAFQCDEQGITGYRRTVLVPITQLKEQQAEEEQRLVQGCSVSGGRQTGGQEVGSGVCPADLILVPPGAETG